MCGIIAIIKKKRDGEQLIKKMLYQIVHRGDSPPSYAIYNNTLLGSVRLKIVDRSSSPMPLYNENKNIAIVFNGEIYNYKELRTDLILKGHKFNTETDTEVLLHLYEEYGVEMLMLLDGMFSFVIYSIDSKDFFASRDRWGIKPLFYSTFNNTTYIASEIKAFDNIPKVEIIKELKPGQYIMNNKISTYFNPLYKIAKISYKDAKSKVRTILEKAVQKRVGTDLPIAVFLSGGVDSSIVYLLARKYHSDVTAIVIGKNDSSDVIIAKRLCKKIGTNCLHVNITEKEFLNNIPQVIKTIESFEPNPVRGAALSYYLAKFAKEKGFKIVLCGEGSDEIFGGYGDFINLKQSEFQLLTKKLISDLHRTQLLRIDKTGMAFGVEIREPFMDNELVQLAIKLPPDFKIEKKKRNPLTKYILRDAFKDMLPEFIFNRGKKTLMEGAGANSVQKGEGIFHEHACRNLTKSEYRDIQKSYPIYKLNNIEDAFYFKIYKEIYGNRVYNSYVRTYNAIKEIKSP